jgi:membrane protease YdiL (CAAX protease family)
MTENHDPSPPKPHRRPVPPNDLLRWGILLGLIMIVAASIWTGFFRDRNLIEYWFAGGVFVQIIVGAISGATFSFTLWLIGPYFKAFETIRAMLLRTINFEAFRLWHIVIISFLAAVPEEIFFRGALQPVTGLIIASLVFGVLHSITPLYFIYATLAGFGLGLLAEWQDSLWAPIAAHYAVDFVSLLLLTRQVHHDDSTPIETIHLVSGEPPA